VHFDIRHITTYHYDTLVQLGPHILRLTPRSDGNQRLLDYHCTVLPEPAVQSSVLDAEGNVVTRLWFSGTTNELRIESTSRVKTLLENPFDYLLDAPATALPMPYSQNEAPLLASYRHRGSPGAEVVQLAASLARKAEQNTLAFLSALNEFLYNEFEREIRPQGPPKNPEHTLVRRQGACRDLAVLFIAVCRSQGIAARFVSGYQAHAETARQRRYLHAWPEVYIPGGGWRGYDPSHGTAVADGHVAVAAAGLPAGAMPVDGAFYGDGAESRMEFELGIQTDA
jgi:transglutaminase-like putative cysteine protease